MTNANTMAGSYRPAESTYEASILPSDDHLYFTMETDDVETPTGNLASFNLRPEQQTEYSSVAISETNTQEDGVYEEPPS